MKKYINELNSSTSLLSDQLKLMDEKYLVLRGKLDYAREYGTKRVRESEKACSDMRQQMEHLKLEYPNIIIPSLTPSRHSNSASRESESKIFSPIRSKSAKNSMDSSSLRRSHTANPLSSNSRSKTSSMDSLPSMNSNNNTNTNRSLLIVVPVDEEEERLTRVVDKIKKREQVELMSSGKRVWTEQDMKALVK